MIAKIFRKFTKNPNFKKSKKWKYLAGAFLGYYLIRDSEKRKKSENKSEKKPLE